MPPDPMTQETSSEGVVKDEQPNERLEPARLRAAAEALRGGHGWDFGPDSGYTADDREEIATIAIEAYHAAGAGQDG